MKVETVIKLAYIIQAGCAGSMIVIAANSVKEQRKLNEIMLNGTQQMADSNSMMRTFLSSIK